MRFDGDPHRVAVGSADKTSEVLKVGDIVLDVKNVLLWVAGERVSLRLREFDLLTVLASYPEHLVTREELAARVWGNGMTHSLRTIDVYVCRVRAALAQRTSHDYIRNVRSIGYRMVTPDWEAEPVRVRTGVIGSFSKEIILPKEIVSLPTLPTNAGHAEPHGVDLAQRYHNPRQGLPSRGTI